MKKMIVSLCLFYIIVTAFFIYMFVPFVENYLMNDKIDLYAQKMTSGLYYMLIKDLQEIPIEKLPAHVETLKPEFGYPISLVLFEDIDLSVEELADFIDGETIVRKKGKLFYKHVGNSPYALTIGEIEKFAPDDPLLAFLVQWIATTLIVGIIAAIWMLPFWRRLQKISTAATAFGNGQFDVRAEVPGYSSLTNLAVTFNSMAERIQQLITSHKDLVNSVSHELRTPISRIRFGMEMLRTAKKASDRHRHLEGIQGDVDELDALVAELLAYARFDRETPGLELKEYAIVQWLAGEVDKAKRGSGSLDWECRIGLSSDKLKVHFENRLMGRALSNLLQNASQYAESRIEVAVETENGDCLIHVDDDGPGIPENSRDQTFKPFVRLDTSRDRQTGGYGLGLAIVHRITSWHNGQVDITESPLGGARFTIRWPGL